MPLNFTPSRFRPAQAVFRRGRAASRPGLTLVELMVTISIIAILATLALGALLSAQNDAKLMKTRSMVVKLNNLIMPRYESYRTRRVPVTFQSVPTLTPSGYVQLAARTRLNALHELMRMELPDRMTDIIDGPITNQSYKYTTGTPPTFVGTGTPIPRPALSQAYYQALVNATGSTNPQTAQNGGTLNGANQGAECLYMIITLGFVDELGGRDLFNESSIGDTDSDGLPEFIDAWNTPIGFLRWAPGFTDSELQGAGGIEITATSAISLTATGSTLFGSEYGLSSRNNAYAGRTITIYSPPTGMTGAVTQSATIESSTYVPSGTTSTTTFTLKSPGINASAVTGGATFGIDPDPFDPLRAYPYGTKGTLQFGATNDVPIALYPLVYSAGPNRTFGVLTDFPTTLHYYAHNNYPFLADLSGQYAGQMIGTLTNIKSEQNTVSTWEQNGWKDNVHNHLIGLR